MVVLPLVPVTPTTLSSSVGSPQKAAASGAIAALASGTSTSAAPRPRGRSTTSAAAPASTAAAAKSCPSAFSPGTQKNSVPGPARRLSYASPVISILGSPRIFAPTPETPTSSSSLIGRDSRSRPGAFR